MRVAELKEEIEFVAEANGYSRCGSYLFVADWPTSGIDHFLLFKLHGRPRHLLHVDFGLRNIPAQEFAIDCVDPFMPVSLREIVNNKENPCLLRYSLGRLAGWGSLESLDFESMTADQLKCMLGQAIQLHLFPIVKKVDNLESFLDFLSKESDNLANFRGNIGVKTAFIAFLSLRLGKPESAIASEVRLAARTQKRQFSGQGIDSEAFAERTIRLLNCL